MSLKDELIDKIIRSPLQFTDEDFSNLTAKECNLNFDDLRKIIIQVFDINESTLKEESDATSGLMGKLNRKSTAKRREAYFRLIESGFRNKENRSNKVIVAEGDSWFQFPYLITDIIDWLSKEPHYAVYSIAYAGDWFTNILYEEKYVEELSIHNPEVFLISGGGNDFVGSNRLALMVHPEEKYFEIPNTGLRKALLSYEPDNDRADILKGYEHIANSFFSFIWTIKAQYYTLFRNLETSGKYPGMKIITQGYDYVIPTLQFRKKKFLQSFITKKAGSGKWLKRPLLIKGISDDALGKQILKAMIFEINCMFIELATDPTFPNVYHIDCRNTARGWDDWYDELHLNSDRYREIAKTYRRCIDGDGTEKVLRVNEMAVKPGIDDLLRGRENKERALTDQSLLSTIENNKQ
jgi:hypothetical protein